MARNAAIVSINTCFGKYPKTYHTKDDPINWSWEHISNNKWEDIPPVYNYVERMIEDIHCEGAYVLFCTNTGHDTPVAGDSSGQSGNLGMQSDEAVDLATLRNQKTSRSVEEIVKEAREHEKNGYDVYTMDTPSPEAVQAVRAATNLVIMSTLSLGARGTGRGASIPGIANMNRPTADQLAQAVEAAGKLEGLADFVLIRGATCGNWVQEKDEVLANTYYAEAIKKAGVKVLTCIGGGYHDPIKNDELIARGVTDMVGMTRPIFADADLVKKVSAGRAEDVIPCIQCQNCHAVSMTKGPHYTQCTVNARWGTPPYKLAAIQAPLMKKKVAVIGGGPAGMKAATVAAERGHAVTLYEKDSALGGLQKYTDHTKWNWTYKMLKDWLAAQVKKAGVEVKLNTAATPGMIKAANYDTVLVAVGAEVVESRMKGADDGKVFNILTCYSNKKALGKHVVMLGAGKFGTEAAISMVKDGHKVTVLAPGEEMIDPRDVGPHSVGNQERIYKNHPDFTYHMKTVPKSIDGGTVTYMDEKGTEHSIDADSIVIWSGLRPRSAEAVAFSGSADEVILAGDCTGDTDRLIKTLRSAFFAASQI